jgi:YCII-related domain-containing protein
MDPAGLLPSAVGRPVKFSGGNRIVIDGSFPESKQLIAGYWILQVPSMDEAVDWAERFPFEALSRIYPASTAPKASSGSVRCSSRRNEPGTGWMGSRAIAQ